ncbi:hypothetical protein ABTN30_20250, partial [Acinetobacter baumannii]
NNILSVAGTSNLNASQINLVQANTLAGVVTITATGAGSVNLLDTSALTLGNSTFGTGSLAVTGALVTQTGTLAQAASAGDVTVVAT